MEKGVRNEGKYPFETITTEIPFSRTRLKDSSSAHIGASTQTRVLQNTSWHCSHLRIDIHIEPFQRSIILPIQTADSELNILLTHIGGLRRYRLHSRRVPWRQI